MTMLNPLLCPVGVWQCQPQGFIGVYWHLLAFIPLPRSPQVPEALDLQEEPSLPDLGEGSHRAAGAEAV